MTYEWKELPSKAEPKRPKLLTTELMAMLQSRPNEWLFVGRKTRSSWARSAAMHPSGQVECASRNYKQGYADMYLRWVA
jgi:hypothetical protein